MVNREINKTMPITLIDNTIVIAVMTDMVYEMSLVCMPAACEKLRSKATYIIGRSHRTVITSSITDVIANAITSVLVTVIIFPNRKLDKSPDV